MTENDAPAALFEELGSQVRRVELHRRLAR